ncbi:MAG: response regulator transcription factor [Eubacterium sp.]|nr:response regulator transcription factor [Eubacterium sp.]
MIWCVEDDTNIREMELYTLQMANYETRGFSDGESFFDALETEKPALVLLDIMLPQTDGIEILKKIRERRDTEDIAVIMTTARSEEYDKVLSLDLGADDYLVKPFGMMEMVSHVKAVLRRYKPKSAENTLSVGKIYMNLDKHFVRTEQGEAVLTFKEYELLKIFLKNPGRAFTRDQLFASVWGEDYIGESRTVDMHIKTLRHKLGTCGARIETIRNVGYRINPREEI